MASSPSSTTSSSSDAHPTTTRRAPGGKPRVSAEHTLNRVRENQRRHRARRRDYIATLEQKLAETEEQLAAARAEIAVLRAECGRRDSGTATSTTLTTPTTNFPYGEERNAATNNKPDVQVRDIGLFAYQIGSGTGADMLNLAPNSNSNAGSNTGLALGVNKEMVVGPLQLAIGGQDDISSMAEYPNVLSRSLLDTAPASSTTYEALAEIAEPQNDIPVPISVVTGPAPCCEDTPLTPPPDPADPECATCKTRPPPAPTESTTLCTQAYILISQQNFRNLDVATIRLWLYQGYRRAQRQGEGCRVENGVLFRLLDYISGVECDSSTHAISPCTQ